jgi:hypothetical protein
VILYPGDKVKIPSGDVFTVTSVHKGESLPYVCEGEINGQAMVGAFEGKDLELVESHDPVAATLPAPDFAAGARFMEESRRALSAVDWAAGQVAQATTPPVSEHAARKARPLFTGCIAYFPDALGEVARVSVIGNEQHNPGKPLHWSYGKSMDHPDCQVRHLVDFDEPDTDEALHAAKVAWRALAHLQTMLEKRDPALHAKRQAQRERAARGER